MSRKAAMGQHAEALQHCLRSFASMRASHEQRV